MWTKLSDRAKHLLIDFLLIALVIACVIAYLRYAKSPPSSTSTPGPVATAPEAKKAKKVTRKEVKPGPSVLITLDREEAAAALKMPELAKGPDNVLAAVTIPPSGECPVTAVSTLSPEGEGKIVYRTEPRKFLQLKKEFGVRAGAGSGGMISAEVYARPLRVGSVDIELRGYVKRDDRTGGDGGGAVMVDWRF